mmetsp:Transcript_28813/g.85262  ORF Transcript_28813/g.85262 Transcript_28813/m.85262 type:complete len:363 (+) Transcript_28813:1693-2781(+)|eukprot:363941-Chlamydomonas_euryale.AAC.20
MECVLRHVGDAQVRVAPHCAGRGLVLRAQHLDHSRLAGAIGAVHHHARRQRAVEGNVVKRVLGCARVAEVALDHLEDGLVLGLYALQEARLGELERKRSGRQLVVRHGLRLDLDKLRQVAPVCAQLARLVVDDVGAHAVEEARVVRYHDRRHVLKVDQVVLKPLHVVHVQVVSGLVEQQDLRLHQDGARKRQLHLPATRQRANRLVQILIGKADGHEHLLDLVARLASDARVVGDKVKRRRVGLLGVDVVLHVHRAELRRRREALHLAIGNCTHERRLASTVGATEAVALALLQAQARHVEQNLGAVRERKLAVAQVLARLIVLLQRCLGARRLLLGLVQALGDGGVRLSRPSRNQVGLQVV